MQDVINNAKEFQSLRSGKDINIKFTLVGKTMF